MTALTALTVLAAQRHLSPARPPVALGLALALAALAVGCSMPADGTQNVVHGQTAAKPRPVMELDSRIPAVTAGDADGMTRAVVVRDGAQLGAFAASVPARFDFGSHSLVFLGTPRAFELARDQAKELVIVDVPAADAFGPGIVTTDAGLQTMVGITVDKDPCCGTSEAERGACEEDLAAQRRAWASDKLVLFAVPQPTGKVEVTVQRMACE